MPMNADTSHGASEALGLWEPRRTLTLEAARRHSGRVRLMRHGLIGLAVLLVLTLIWEFTRQGTNVFPPDNPSESVKMINPRYSGRTQDGLPYYLTAKEAVRMTADANTVELINPVLEFFREAGVDKSLVIAESGTYDDVEKILNLRTSVDLSTDDGNECKTTHARIFVKTKIVEGDEAISCIGNFGSVNGNAYEILDNYKTFVFKNGMTGILESEE